MGYDLPTKKSGVSKRWVDQKFLMIGHSGIGKSEFWSYGENPLYIETEAGLNFIDAYKMPARSWEDIHGIMGAMFQAIKDGSFIYDVVVVDTVDRVIICIEDEVMRWAKTKYKNGADFEGIGDVPEGCGWYRRESLINKFLKGLEVLPCAKVLVGHSDNKEVKEEGSARGYHKNTINIGGKTGGKILAWSDHTLNVVGKMMGDTLQRTVYTRPTMSREAKSRGGIIPDGWRWDADSKVNFDKLRELFD